jgi:multiple sugar transport system permease protein
MKNTASLNQNILFKGQNRPFLWLNYIVCILYSSILVIPFYYVMVSAFKDNPQIFQFPLSFPKTWGFSNFLRAQEYVNIIRAMGYSFGITAASEVLTLIIGFIASYAIARIPNRMAGPVEIFFSLGFLIPAFAILVPVFMLAASTHLLYKPIFLILFYSATRLPLTIILLASTMRDIPIELEEAAVCDGANLFHILRHIILPLSKSGIATVLILNFISIWNEYLFALVLLNQDTRTLQLVLPLLKTMRTTEVGLVFAGVIIATIPVVIIFILFQERIMSGIFSGSIKE